MAVDDVAAEGLSQQVISWRGAWPRTASMLEREWPIQISGRPQQGIQVKNVSELWQWCHHDHPSWKLPHYHCKTLNLLTWTTEHRSKGEHLNKCHNFSCFWQEQGSACLGILGTADIDMYLIGGEKFRNQTQFVSAIRKDTLSCVKQSTCMDLLFCSNHNAGSVGDIRQRGREDWMGTFADWQDAPRLRTWPLHASDQSVCVTHWHWGWEGWKYVIVLSKIKECNKGTWDVRNLYVPPSDHYKMNSIFSIRFSTEIVKLSMYSVHPCASKVSLIKQW